MDTEQRVVTPPRALISSNPLKWFSFFGPGVIIASVTVGSGEILFPSRGGAIFGFRVLYVFLFIALLKWIFVYSSMRHMILSGGHPLERWNWIPGPRGWLPLFMFIILVVAIPIWYSFLSGLTGLTCAWIFGVGDHYLWATVSVAAAALLLARGGYNFLENAQKIILGLLVAGILVAVFYVAPNWADIAKGFIPQPLSYPDWLYGIMPEMRSRSVWVEIMVYASVIGGLSFDYLAYLSFLRDKKWGWSHLETATSEQLDLIAKQKDHPARLWLRAALVDTVASFVMVVVISSCFCILGAIILQPDQRVPEGLNLLNHQASFLTTLSPWLLPVYQLAVFLAFFGVLYGAPELYYRVAYEYLNSLPRWRGRLLARNVRVGVFSWTLVGGLLILWGSRFFPDVGLIDIVTPAGIYAGVLACGFYAMVNPWVDWRFLPAPLRMSGWLVMANIFAGLAFTFMGLKALWDYGQLGAYLTLAGLLLACFLLASQLRFLHRITASPQRPVAS